MGTSGRGQSHAGGSSRPYFSEVKLAQAEKDRRAFRLNALQWRSSKLSTRVNESVRLTRLTCLLSRLFPKRQAV